MRNLLSKPGGSGGSFLPEDYVERKAETRANFITLALFAIVMFLVVSAFFVTNRRWVTIRAEQMAINQAYAQEKAKIDQLDALSKERRKMLAKAEVTTALLEKIPRSVLVASLVTEIPTNITVEEIELSSKRIDPNKELLAAQQAQGQSKVPPPAGGKVKSLAPGANKGGKDVKAEEVKPEVKPPRFESTVKITGISTVYTDITDYAAVLQRNPLLTRIELVYIKEAKIKEQMFHKFEITASLRADADARQLARPDQLGGANDAGLVSGNSTGNSAGDKQATAGEPAEQK